MSKIPLTNTLFQSPYTYLQAAGSNATDGSAEGIHLRWDFLRNLGDEHLPKGNLAGSTGPYRTTQGFNRSNDFVNIYRVRYDREYTVVLDLAVAPSAVKTSADSIQWVYASVIPVAADQSNKTQPVIEFLDVAAYNALASTLNPATNPLEFIKQYTGPMSAYTANKLMFKGVFDLGIKNALDNTSGVAAEAVSVKHEDFYAVNDDSKYFVAARKILKRLDTTDRRTFMGENFVFFRFNSRNTYVRKITFSTYVDHIIGENNRNSPGNWSLVGQFSLDDGNSDNNAEVFRRLEDLSKYPINKRWPKYNDINLTTGQCTVKVQNYKDKWLNPLGLKQGVIDYLTLSITDRFAISHLPSDNPDDLARSRVSYLDMLKLVSLDFHAARMLGLGHIDQTPLFTTGVLDGGLSSSVVIDYINNITHTTTQVRNYVINNAPSSEAVLLALLNRPIPLLPNQLKDVLLATAHLPESVLIKAIDNLLLTTTSVIEQVLIANSPLTDNVLLAVINKGLLFSSTAIQNILAANYPLSNNVLKAIINRTTPLNAATVEAVMKLNSPLSDDVLVSLAVKSSLLQPLNVQAIFQVNTPVSPLVEDALRNRVPALPVNILDSILNNNVINGTFDATKFIYVLVYQTDVAIEQFPKASRAHVYMAIPTSKSDFRLPPTPALKPITYGLFLNNATESPTELTDQNGYARFADERFINLNRDRFRFESPMESFYATPAEFSICEESLPVGYGIEYKLSSENAFRKPELNNDPLYTDPTGLAETIIVPAMDKELVFNHQEKEPGIHEYGLYGINWFSRVSPVGNHRLTDETKFPKRNTLLPPLNLAVQLIQKESPLVFTTSAEQTKLNGLTDPDKTLVRTTFDWNFNHNKAYQFADYAEFFFRPTEPLKTRGQVLSVTQLTDHRVSVTTKDFLISSTDPPQVVQPNIAAGDVGKYVGSAFVVNGKTFIVQSVTSSGNNPTFVLHQLRETNTTDMDNNNVFTVSETFVSPQPNDFFIVVENLAESSNWDTKLSQKVYLEPFHTVAGLQLQGSSTASNNKIYTVLSAALSGANTVITVAEAIPAPTATVKGNIVFKKRMIVTAVDSALKRFTVAGNVSTQVANGSTITIRGSKTIDSNYTVTSVTTGGGNTFIQVAENVASNPAGFYLFFNRTIAITVLNGTNKTMTVAGNQTADIVPIYRETVTNEDGSQKIVPIGGIFAKANIVEFLDKDTHGDPIPGSHTGVYSLTFDTYQLPNHVNTDIFWSKGIARVIENATYLPPVDDPNRTVPEIKVLDVWDIDNSGTTLKLTVYDSSFDVNSSYQPKGSYVPIKTGTHLDVNFHPSYKTYLKADTGSSSNFNQGTILPSVGEGMRQTLMTARSLDADETPVLSSYLTTPVVLIAQELVEPLAPGLPSGGNYATPPDFYGKSTYTFDVTVQTSSSRQPHMLVFYRANERSILDQLYRPSTANSIVADLEALTGFDASVSSISKRWNDLVNLELDANGLFKPANQDGYCFPIPDNEQYSIPRADITETPVFPFNGTTPPGQMIDVMKQAINGAFLPLTEQPIVYSLLKDGRLTYGNPPKIRDNDGRMLYQGDAGYDPFPMASKYSNGSSFVRFTDFTLDGASQNIYFYFGIELSNQLKVSDRSPVKGPVFMVNTSPAEEPEIKRVLTQLPNLAASLPAAVRFEIDEYIASENIAKLELFRTTNPSDSLSVRTMTPLGQIDLGEDVLDNFSDLPFPLYGEPLFYRVVAYRKIINNDLPEYIPSKPSKVVLTNVVDSINPAAPLIRSHSTSNTMEMLQNVTLTWAPTCYNGTYSVQKLNNSGNWVEVYKVKSNDPEIRYPAIGSPALDLPRQDDNGMPIYHRYRVVVENSSGLFNLSQLELTLATGPFDIQQTDVVSYTDSTHSQSTLQSGEIDKGVNNPGFMTFTDIASPLPAGHSTFIETDVTVKDSQGNSATKTISTVGGSVTFNHGDAGLILDSSIPNQIFSVTTKTVTDYATSGAIKKYTLNYVSSPCHDLLQLSNRLISLTDSTHTIDPYTSSQINDGVAYPGSLAIGDVSDLSTLGQTFSSMEVAITDMLGNTSTKTIASAGGTVTFNNGEGGLVLDGTVPNQTFEISVTLFTDGCSTGTAFSFTASYSS